MTSAFLYNVEIKQLILVNRSFPVFPARQSALTMNGRFLCGIGDFAPVYQIRSPWADSGRIGVDQRARPDRSARRSLLA